MTYVLSVINQWKSGVGEVQFLLAIGLFFIVNFIGSKTYSIGYVPISLLTNEDSKLAFNFAIRVISPVIYLIIISAILYQFGLDVFVYRFYLVSVYYLFFRYLINGIEGRLQLLNWGRQIIYSFSILFLSRFIYIKFIIDKKNLLPDFANLSNELWIIIILFIYKIINDLDISVDGSEKRKEAYICKNYLYFKNRYSKLIDERIDNDILKAIVYAIIIYENFNRSKTVRFVENISFLIKKDTHTLGVMQVKANRLISDEESVVIGIRKIKEDYSEFLLDRQKHRHYIYASDDSNYMNSIAMNEIISRYNTGDMYSTEVSNIAEKLLSKFFPNTKDVLVPPTQESDDSTVQ